MLTPIHDAGVVARSDWSRIRYVFSHILDQIDQGNWDHRVEFDQAMQGYIYSLGTNGSVIVSPRSDGSPWWFWEGKWLESLLPWSAKAKKLLIANGINITNISYHTHTYSVEAHRDTKYRDFANLTPHTNINFVISCEQPKKSYTWVQDDAGNESRYYSDTKYLWIINASNLHGVYNQGYREGLIIKTLQPYDEIADFFNQHPYFFNEDQSYFRS